LTGGLDNIIRSTGTGEQTTAILIGKNSSNIQATDNIISGGKKIENEKK
jgi:hypothetical protein